jgi:hypothetical protein
MDPVLLFIGLASGYTAPTLTASLLNGVLNVGVSRDGTSAHGGVWDS